MNKRGLIDIFEELASLKEEELRINKRIKELEAEYEPMLPWGKEFYFSLSNGRNVSIEWSEDKRTLRIIKEIK